MLKCLIIKAHDGHKITKDVGQLDVMWSIKLGIMFYANKHDLIRSMLKTMETFVPSPLLKKESDDLYISCHHYQSSH